MWSGTRVLVTGGTGFLGTALVRRLRSLGAEAWVVATRPSAQEKHLCADMTRLDDVRSVLNDVSPEIVFHCASYGVRIDQNDEARMIEVNVRGTEHLLRACETIRPRCIVVAGSWTELGASPYGQSRRRATDAACAWARQNSIPLTVLRFAQLFGPGESSYRLIPTLLRSLTLREPAVLGSSNTVRDFVYIEDAVDACIAAASHPTRGDIVAVASGTERTLREVVDVFKRIAPELLEPQWTCATARPWDESWISMDPEEAARALGWSAQTTFEEGLRQCMDACVSSSVAYHPFT